MGPVIVTGLPISGMDGKGTRTYVGGEEVEMPAKFPELQGGSRKNTMNPAMREFCFIYI